MIGIIIIAVGVEAAFKSQDFMAIMIGYVIMRVPYILLWLKVARDDPQSRPVALRYALGVFLVQIGWTSTVLFYQSWYAWGALLLAELAVPWFAERSTDKGQNTKYHHEHLEERMGLLTIIVLGESILASVNAFQKLFGHVTPELVSTVAGALMILFSMWWLYFDDKIEKKLHTEHYTFLWSYGHYFIFAAAAAVGALISVNIDALTHHGHISPAYAAVGLSIALAIYLVAVWVCHDFILGKKGIHGLAILILAVVVLVMAYVTHSVLLMGMAFAVLNVIRVIRKHRTCQLANS